MTVPEAARPIDTDLGQLAFWAESSSSTLNLSGSRASDVRPVNPGAFFAPFWREGLRPDRVHPSLAHIYFALWQVSSRLKFSEVVNQPGRCDASSWWLRTADRRANYFIIFELRVALVRLSGNRCRVRLRPPPDPSFGTRSPPEASPCYLLTRRALRSPMCAEAGAVFDGDARDRAAL